MIAWMVDAQTDGKKDGWKEGTRIREEEKDEELLLKEGKKERKGRNLGSEGLGGCDPSLVYFLTHYVSRRKPGETTERFGERSAEEATIEELAPCMKMKYGKRRRGYRESKQ